jgi:aspartate/methionine/tyrosine aminotransferase
VNISPFLLERHFAKYEFEVPYQLSCSDCEPLSLSELLAMATPDSIRLWENLRFSYTESTGHPLLREEISLLYEEINPQDILVCVPEEGIFLVMNSLLEPGDHMVVISPAYQSLHEIAKSTGIEVSYWEPDDEGLYSADRLEGLFTPKTRMVVINFPHNPTGAHIKRVELDEIVRFCQKHEIILFSDEMYRGLEQDPADRLPCAASLMERCISLSGMSKSFALPGLRIGWLVCKNSKIRERMLQLKDYVTICASAPSEVLSIIALQNKGRILARNMSLINRNIKLVNDLVERNREKVEWNPPKAGSVALLYLLKTQKIEQFCQDLLDQKEVMAVGSHLFNYERPAVRLGLGRMDFGIALERFEDFLRVS